MKVIIAGGREITDYRVVCEAMNAFVFKGEVTEVVSGGAQGVDKLGEQWAGNRDIPLTQFLADWNRHGRSAGPIRNRQMAAYTAPDGALVAIWDGYSRGTKNMIDEAKRRGLRVFVYRVPPVKEAAC